MSRPLSRYKQIEADLLAQTADGRYKKGSCIPPEQELAKQYGVSRVTMRKALEGLVAQGLLVRTPGAGTFVSRLPQAGKLPGVVSFADEMRAQGLTPRTEVTEFRLEPADGDTARRLGVEPGAPVYFFRRSQYADEVLFMLETSRMSAQEYPGISLQALQSGKYRYFQQELGRQVACSRHTVTPILADEATAKAFGIPAGTPLLRDENTTYLDDGRILDFTVQVYNSPHYRLEYVRR